LLFFLLPLLLFGLLIRTLKNRIDDILLNEVGQWPYFLFAAIGTPIHEASHLLTCLIFRHRIKRFNLFFPDKNGRLGYVEHLYDPKSLYQRIGCFFIGLSPLLGGAALLYLLTRLFYPELPFNGRIALMPRVEDVHGLSFLVPFFKSIREAFFGFFNPMIHLVRHEALWLKPILFFFLVTAVGSHMFPSRSDFQGMIPGLLILSILILLVHLGLYWVGVDFYDLMARSAGAMGFMLNLLFFISLMLVAVWMVFLVFRLFRKILFR